VGNVFSGQVVGETAKILSQRFGKGVEERPGAFKMRTFG